MTERQRRQALRKLWMDNHSEEERTEQHVIVFHAWLEKNWPELLGKKTIEELKTDLEFLWS